MSRLKKLYLKNIGYIYFVIVLYIVCLVGASDSGEPLGSVIPKLLAAVCVLIVTLIIHAILLDKIRDTFACAEND